MQEIDIVLPFPVDGLKQTQGARQRTSVNDGSWPNCVLGAGSAGDLAGRQWPPSSGVRPLGAHGPVRARGYAALAPGSDKKNEIHNATSRAKPLRNATSLCMTLL